MGDVEGLWGREQKFLNTMMPQFMFKDVIVALTGIFMQGEESMTKKEKRRPWLEDTLIDEADLSPCFLCF